MTAVVCLWSGGASAIDWSRVPGREIVLMYPGQSSWEWSMTPADHSGAVRFREGKNCHDCHQDEEKMQGNLMVTGRKNELSTIAGKPGHVVAMVKFAHDDKMLYVHLDFDEGQQPNVKMDPDFATKVTLMLGDSKVPEAMRAGCWVACHEDASKMPAANGDRTKYLPKTRTKIGRTGGGDELKPADELGKLMADGYLLEYWQARLNPGAKPVAATAVVFDKRQESKTPIINVEATSVKTSWSLTVSRPLIAGAPYKDLVPGSPYVFGIAIHGGHTAKRFHYVSYEYSFAIDHGQADFIVKE